MSPETAGWIGAGLVVLVLIVVVILVWRFWRWGWVITVQESNRVGSIDNGLVERRSLEAALADLTASHNYVQGPNWLASSTSLRPR